MTPRFLAFIPFIKTWETDYKRGHDGDDNFVLVEHDPDDPGGTTKWGIDRRSDPGVNIAGLTWPDAEQIYFNQYWTKNDCETMPPMFGECYMNACVNCGPGRAMRLKLISGTDPFKFVDAQEAFYNSLVQARPSSQKYLAGWLNRTHALRKYVGLEKY